ncbi:hypothetical protein BDV10DRAFT_190372 [Aspergillus recurvatus]
MSNGKVTRLRASCDACNESKVRCSQTKPCCARCEKQRLTCVYGLSRRTHKDAPRIGALHAAAPAQSTAPVETSPRPSFSSPLSPPPPSSPGRDTSIAAGPTVSTEKTSASSDCPIFPPDDDAFTAPGGPLLASSASRAEPGDGLDEYMRQLSDPMDASLDFDAALNTIQDLFPVPGFTSPDHWLPPPAASEVGNASADGIDHSRPCQSALGEGAAPAGPAAQQNGAACSCSPQVINVLVSAPLTGRGPESEDPSFDAQLSQLRRAVKVSEGCFACSCIVQDEMTIRRTGRTRTRPTAESPPPPLLCYLCACILDELTGRSFDPWRIRTVLVSVLIGRALQGFEATLSKLRPSSGHCASSANASFHKGRRATVAASTTPRLSWGALQIEPDEEEELKEHLWLLQFRKLGRVLDMFSSSLGRLRNSDNKNSTSDSSAHVMACRCIHMWLVHKAGSIGDCYGREHDALRTPRPSSSMAAVP